MFFKFSDCSSTVSFDTPETSAAAAAAADVVVVVVIFSHLIFTLMKFFLQTNYQVNINKLICSEKMPNICNWKSNRILKSICHWKMLTRILGIKLEFLIDLFSISNFHFQNRFILIHFTENLNIYFIHIPH